MNVCHRGVTFSHQAQIQEFNRESPTWIRLLGAQTQNYPTNNPLPVSLLLCWLNNGKGPCRGRFPQILARVPNFSKAHLLKSQTHLSQVWAFANSFVKFWGNRSVSTRLPCSGTCMGLCNWNQSWWCMCVCTFGFSCLTKHWKHCVPMSLQASG